MSLVNQVLKDLEKNTLQSNLKLQAVSDKPSNFPVNKTVLFTSTGLALMALYFFWPQKPNDTGLHSEFNNAVISQNSKKTTDHSESTSIKANLVDSKTDIKAKVQKEENKTASNKEETGGVRNDELTRKAKLTSSKSDSVSSFKSESKSKPKSDSIAKLQPKTKPNSNLARIESSKAILSENKSTIAKTSNIIESKNKKSIKKTSNESQLKLRLSQIIKDRSIFGTQHAFDNLNRLVNENPAFDQARLQLIKLAWTDQRTLLPAILEKAIIQSPEQSAFYVAYARYYLEERQTQNAFSVINQFQNIDNSAEVLKFRALLNQKLNNHQAAVRDYQKVIQLASANDSTYLALGISLEAIGETERAKNSYRKALTGRSLSSQQLKFVENKLSSLQG